LPRSSKEGSEKVKKEGFWGTPYPAVWRRVGRKGGGERGGMGVEEKNHRAGGRRKLVSFETAAPAEWIETGKGKGKMEKRELKEKAVEETKGG